VDHAFDVRNSHGAIVSLQVKRLFGHQAPITVLAITDTHLYSGSSDKTIIEWDLTTHTQLNCLEGHDGTLRALVVSPDSDMLYSACEAGVIASWDLCVMSQTASVQQCHDFPITALALSAGRLFSADDKGTLKAWDACMIGTPDHDELEWPSKQAHTHTITALAATATNLYSAGIYVKVWDSQTLTMILKVKMHSGLTTAMCLRGDRIYSGSRAIKVWDVYTLERTSAPSLKKHSHPVTAIAVSHDGKRLYSAAHVIKVRYLRVCLYLLYWDDRYM
jgi:WD40 repeat protein